MNQEQLAKMITSTIPFIIRADTRSYTWADYKNVSLTSNAFRYSFTIQFDNYNLEFDSEYQHLRTPFIRLFQDIVVKKISSPCGDDVVVKRTVDLFKCLFVKTIEYLAEEITEAIMKNMEEVKSLQFCKITNDFTTPEFKEMKELTASTFGYLNIGECCVCYENTTARTPCGHHLCYECWATLKKTICPMCRDDIGHTRQCNYQYCHHDEEYSSDDEE